MATRTRVPSTGSVTGALSLWHLLSLDAPTVATLWTLFVARESRIFLPAASLVSMFLAVWILYAADRLLDSRGPAGEMEERHRFHAQYRRAFLFALAAATAILASLLTRLSAAALQLFLVLAVFLFAWFLLIHVPTARGRSRPRRLPKEIAVGLFFSAAVFIPTVARAPTLRRSLLPSAVLFAALCCLNCLYIYAWEHRTQRSRSEAHRITRRALERLPAISSYLSVAAITAAWRQHTLLPLPIALSAGLLLLLDRWRPRDATLLRTAADLALLTPVLFLVH